MQRTLVIWLVILALCSTAQAARLAPSQPKKQRAGVNLMLSRPGKSNLCVATVAVKDAAGAPLPAGVSVTLKWAHLAQPVVLSTNDLGRASTTSKMDAAAKSCTVRVTTVTGMTVPAAQSTRTIKWK